MIISKLISIDTSIFGKIAKDYYSNDKKRTEQAFNFVEYIITSGFVPFFSHHHIEEIVQYDDENEVFNRWSLIKKFPSVARLCHYKEELVLGSIVDIHRAEVKYLVSESNWNRKDILNSVRNDLIKYTSGEAFVNKYESPYSQLGDSALIDNQKSKRIESLSHIKDKNIDRMKLSELSSSRLKSLPEVNASLEEYEKQLKASIREKGDKKLQDTEVVVEQFIEDVTNDGVLLYENDNLSLLDKALRVSGVRPDQINSKTTVDDLGYLAVYNSKTEVIAESLNKEIDDFKNLSPDDVSSWVIWRELDKMMKNETYAHGSNVNDKYMAIFAFYIDMTLVDKRVHDYFIRLRRKLPELSKYFKKVEKLSHYSKLKDFA